MKTMNKYSVLVSLLFSIGIGICSITMQAMETSTIFPQGKSEDEIHQELLGKVKKLAGYDDIYVGAGYSGQAEPMFFAMEKLDNQNEQIWRGYAYALYKTGGILGQLRGLAHHCDKEFREELREKEDFYRIGLMDTMCPNKQKFTKMFDTGTRAGITGFNEILDVGVYVAYASTQPITGPFRPKKEIGSAPTLEKFEEAYSDIIISVGVDMKELGTSRTEHRGIFKNPFVDIQGTYKNIAMKLHGWAGAVEERIFHKTYMTVYPTPPAAELLHRSVKPGDMYIGVDAYPNFSYGVAEDAELIKKFPPIKKELIGYAPQNSYAGEPVHIFDLKVLSKYYTE